MANIYLNGSTQDKIKVNITDVTWEDLNRIGGQPATIEDIRITVTDSGNNVVEQTFDIEQGHRENPNWVSFAKEFGGLFTDGWYTVRVYFSPDPGMRHNQVYEQQIYLSSDGPAIALDRYDFLYDGILQVKLKVTDISGLSPYDNTSLVSFRADPGSSNYGDIYKPATQMYGFAYKSNKIPPGTTGIKIYAWANDFLENNSGQVEVLSNGGSLSMPPLPPAQDVRVKSFTHDTVTFDWNSYTTDAGARYVFEFWSGDFLIDSGTISSEFTQKTFSMTPGTSYTLKLRNENYAGLGAQDTVDFLYTAPSVSLNASVDGYTGISANWTASGSSPITNYDVRLYSLSDNALVFDWGSLGLLRTYSNRRLDPGKSYALSVRATDAAGSVVVAVENLQLWPELHKRAIGSRYDSLKRVHPRMKKRNYPNA